ncbi:hypothetical protein [Pyruvatibacter mobilis]|uniref:hypothetical protein n=1 Tax=Pyruvatibacter mobilis TaxID=1712261 RepID=UPI003C7EAA1C
MVAEKKSDDIYVELPDGLNRAQVMAAVERAAASVGIYISHIGGYSRKKYPGSVHWHFKRTPKERGLIDATYWDVKQLFWLMIRHREPQWVHSMAPRLRRALAREFAAAVG